MQRARPLPASPLPQPHQLADLGALLCLYRARPGGELDGWAHAVRATYAGGLDSDGVRERLLFFDRDDRCCWQLHVLPDTDFLAWEYLVARVATQQESASMNVDERLWRRLAACMQAGQWLGSALRLHALPTGPGFALSPTLVLAASPASLSLVGVAAARRIARSEGAGSHALEDECCCRQVPSNATTCAGKPEHGSGDRCRDQDVYSLIRFNLRERA